MQRTATTLYAWNTIIISSLFILCYSQKDLKWITVQGSEFINHLNKSNRT